MFKRINEETGQKESEGRKKWSREGELSPQCPRVSATLAAAGGSGGALGELLGAYNPRGARAIGKEREAG